MSAGLVVIVVVQAIYLCFGDKLLTPHPQETLFNNLFQNYNKELFPVIDGKGGMNISLTFHLLSINGLSETTETLSVTAAIKLSWTDEFLAWEESDGNPSSLLIDRDRLWIPIIHVHNSISGNHRILDTHGKVVLHNDGRIEMTHGAAIETHCKILITKFPFDTQTCMIKISAFHGLETRERVVPTYNNMLAFFEKNGEWELREISIEEVLTPLQDGFDYKIVVITLDLERLPKFHVFNSILPIIFISVLNTAVFLMPDADGEKIGTCLSFLLSYVIFLSYINDVLPSKSDTTCYFSVYMVSLFFISSLVTLVTVLSLSMYHTSTSNPIRRGWRIVVLVASIGYETTKDADEQNDQLAWQDVSKAVNKVAFWSFLISVVGVHVGFFYMTLV